MKKGYKILGLIFIGLLMINLFGGVVSANNSAGDSNNGINEKVMDFLKNDYVHPIIGILFGLWDLDKETFVNGLKDIIVYLVILVVFLFAFVSVIKMVGFFDDGVSWIIAAGLTIVAGQLGLVGSFMMFIAGIVAFVGIFGVWLEILIIAVLFFGMIIGANWAGKWALKRRLIREAMKTKEGVAHTKQAIEALKSVQASFEKKSK